MRIGTAGNAGIFYRGTEEYEKIYWSAPEYALLGKVVRGLDVVRAIGKLGDPASGEAGTPPRTVVIEETRVSES